MLSTTSIEVDFRYTMRIPRATGLGAVYRVTVNCGGHGHPVKPATTRRTETSALRNRQTIGAKPSKFILKVAQAVFDLVRFKNGECPWQRLHLNCAIADRYSMVLTQRRISSAYGWRIDRARILRH